MIAIPYLMNENNKNNHLHALTKNPKPKIPMETPSPPPPSPPPPPPPPPIAFAGFLPPSALTDTLLHLSREVSSISDDLPPLQTKNIISMIRRLNLLSSLFEDLSDASSAAFATPLPPSIVLCMTELSITIRKTKSLIEETKQRSLLWSLMQTELVSQRFHVLACEIARALDILPVSLLGLSADVKEQVELLHRQTKRASIFVDPLETRMREELLEAMAASGGGERTMKAILLRLGMRRAEDYAAEIGRLEAEVERQAGTGGLVAVSNVKGLIGLVSRAMDASDDQRFMRRSATVREECSVLMTSVPDEYRCPISLDLMKEPVIIASGHSYDRSSISRWINSGHLTCPKSGLRLMHKALIPNYALKSLINQWCHENNIQLSPTTNAGTDAPRSMDHISAARVAVDAARMAAEFLVGKLAMGGPGIQRQAAYELRLLAKAGMDNRRLIAEAGAIPFLVTLLDSPDACTQENAVTALLNLSILGNNKNLIMSAAGAIDGVIRVVGAGKAAEARENAAATIFSLSMVDEWKVAIGAREGAFDALVRLLREGASAAKKDAACALYNLAVYVGNRPLIVKAGAVEVLVGVLMDDRAGITDDALALMAALCGCAEGAEEMGRCRVAVAVLVDLLRFGTAKGKENAVAVMLGMCRNGGEEIARRLLMNPRSVPSLQGLAADGCSPRAKRKAEAILRLLNRFCSQAQRS
ncbi:U-box domain-containing protein 17 [Acorus gramineus]|uniref:RING-type E3 ubiquitin transferase n=1 Tax=Acorus gramineus TaxID=55184 RepID=A0AAV9AK95_ACOGR|nr:U-box domain-containing protein 17 [Acorus gramineus]